MNGIYKIVEIHNADSFSGYPERVLWRKGKIDYAHPVVSHSDDWYQGGFTFIDGAEPSSTFFYRVRLQRVEPMEANA